MLQAHLRVSQKTLTFTTSWEYLLFLSQSLQLEVKCFAIGHNRLISYYSELYIHSHLAVDEV